MERRKFLASSLAASALPATAADDYVKAEQVVTAKARGVLETYFYFFMSLLIAAIVVYGFSSTLGKNLIHPAIPRPLFLYIHAAVFSGWLVFFTLQSALVRTHNVRWHRRIGWLGLGLGIAIIVVGTSTSIIMTRFDIVQLHSSDADSFMMIPLFDMVCFTTTFPLAIYWRKKPELHRRLMFIATCALTAAAFGRFPVRILPREFFYAGVDLLILLGVMRDLVVNGSVHRVYLYALPAFIVGQTIVSYTAFHALPYWRTIAHTILG